MLACSLRHLGEMALDQAPVADAFRRRRGRQRRKRLRRPDVSREQIRDRFLSLVGASQTLLANAGLPETEPGAAALRKLEEAPFEVFSAMDDTVKHAIESAEVRSFMLKTDDACIYFVVVPNRPEHLRLLNRNNTFSGGWLHHVNTVRSSLVASGDPSSIVILLCSVNPLNWNATLQVSCAGVQNILIPASLAGGDATAPGVRTFDGGADFNLAA